MCVCVVLIVAPIWGEGPTKLSLSLTCCRSPHGPTRVSKALERRAGLGRGLETWVTPPGAPALRFIRSHVLKSGEEKEMSA